MIRYEQINHHINLGRLLPLISAHIEEVFDDGNLDCAQLMNLLNNNLAAIFVVLDEEKVIGYTLSTLTRDIFRAHVIQGELLAIYIKPDYRAKGIAQKLIAFTEMQLAEKYNVQRILTNAKGRKSLVALYKRAGYRENLVQVIKEL